MSNCLTRRRIHFFQQWNYGTSGNLAQAKAIVSALKASGYHFGIYSSPGVSLTGVFFMVPKC